MPVPSSASFADSIPPFFQPASPENTRTAPLAQTELPSYSQPYLLSQEEIGHRHQSIGIRPYSKARVKRRAEPGSSCETKSQREGTSGQGKGRFQKIGAPQKEGSRICASSQAKSPKRGASHTGSMARASPDRLAINASSRFSPYSKRGIDAPDNTTKQRTKIQVGKGRTFQRGVPASSLKHRRRGSSEGDDVDDGYYDDDGRLGREKIRRFRPVHNQQSHDDHDYDQIPSESSEDGFTTEAYSNEEDNNRERGVDSDEEEEDVVEDEEGVVEGEGRVSEDEEDSDNNEDRPQLIPKPDGEVGRPGRGGYSLSESLGWTKKDYQRLTDVVKMCMKQTLDVGKSFGEQQTEAIDLVCRLVVKKLPDISNYEDSWPVKDIIRGQLKYQRTQKRIKEAEANAELGRRFKKAAARR